MNAHSPTKLEVLDGLVKYYRKRRTDVITQEGEEAGQRLFELKIGSKDPDQTFLSQCAETEDNQGIRLVEAWYEIQALLEKLRRGKGQATDTNKLTTLLHSSPFPMAVYGTSKVEILIFRQKYEVSLWLASLRAGTDPCENAYVKLELFLRDHGLDPRQVGTSKEELASFRKKYVH